MAARSQKIASTIAGLTLLLAAAGCSTGGTATAASVTLSSSTSETSDTSTSDTSTSAPESSASDTSSSEDTTSSEDTISSSDTSSSEDTTSSSDSSDESITTPSTLPSTSDSSTSSSGSSSTTSSSSSSAGPGGKLDPATVTWFTNGCTIQKQLRALASPKTSGDLANVQKQVSEAYAKLSAAGAAGKAKLSSTPPPAVPGGDKFKAGQLARMQAISDGYGRGSKTIAAGSYASAAELKAAIDKVESGVSAGVDKAVAQGPALPDDVKAKVKALPACVGVN